MRRRAACIVVALFVAAPAARAQTLAEVAARLPTCSATPIAGLSGQLLATFQCLHPGYLVPVDGGPGGRVRASTGGDAPAHMALSPDARDRLYQLAAAYGVISVNDTYRTAADQYLFHLAGDRAGCLGGPATAGSGRHEMGVAVDVNRGDAIDGATSDGVCCRPLNGDSVHFECRPGCVGGSASISGSGTDLAVRRWGVEAFQHLWNVNNPGDAIDEDGIFGPITRARMEASPAGGFARGGCAPVVDDDRDGSPQGVDCDDHDARRAPGRAEACDLVDNDCDGRVDDFTRACGSDVGACRRGVERCAMGVWGACTGGVTAVAERCDGVDDDCDGEVDGAQVCDREEAAFAEASEGGMTDVDGDGRSDACTRTPEGFRCALSSGHGVSRVVPGPALADGDLARSLSLRMGDLDGDGRADVCARGVDAFTCWRSRATGLDAGIVGPRVPAGLTNVLMADVDADGRDDLCLRASSGLRCHLSTGEGFDGALSLDALSDADGFDDVAYFGTLRMGDLDGDGRADVCARAADGVRCWLAAPGRFGQRVDGPAWSDARGFRAVSYWSTVRMADVTGDGRAEVCARTPDGFACHAVSSQGVGPAVRGPALDEADGWSRPERYATLRMGDVDGDGAADLCARDGESMRCWLFTGHDFGRQVIGPSLPDAEGWNTPRRFRTLRLADVTGDGRADLCARASDGLRCDESDGAGFSHRWPGDLWRDADGFTDLAYDASLRVAGVARAGVTPGAPGCACATDASRGEANAAALGLAVCAMMARRRRPPPR